MTKDWVYKYGSKGIKKIQEKFDIVREVSSSLYLTFRLSPIKTHLKTHGQKRRSKRSSLGKNRSSMRLKTK